MSTINFSGLNFEIQADGRVVERDLNPLEALLKEHGLSGVTLAMPEVVTGRNGTQSVLNARVSAGNENAILVVDRQTGGLRAVQQRRRPAWSDWLGLFRVSAAAMANGAGTTWCVENGFDEAPPTPVELESWWRDARKGNPLLNGLRGTVNCFFGVRNEAGELVLRDEYDGSGVQYAIETSAAQVGDYVTAVLDRLRQVEWSDGFRTILDTLTIAAGAAILAQLDEAAQQLGYESYAELPQNTRTRGSFGSDGPTEEADVTVPQAAPVDL